MSDKFPFSAMPPKMRESFKYMEFMTSLGTTLTRWQGVEAALYSLYCSLFWKAQDVAAAAIWSTLIHTDVKIRVVDSLMELRFHKTHPLAERWRKYLKLIRQNILWRNKLAHWQLMSLNLDLVLVPPLQTNLPISSLSVDIDNSAVGTPKLDELGVTFLGLANGIHQFDKEVWALLSAHESSPVELQLYGPPLPLETGKK